MRQSCDSDPHCGLHAESAALSQRSRMECATPPHRIPQLISRESIQIPSQSSLDSLRFSIFERKVRMNQLTVRHQALLLFSFRLIIHRTPINVREFRCGARRSRKPISSAACSISCSNFMFGLSLESLVENSNTARAAVENSIMNQSLMLLQLRKLLYIGN